jgi:hypothetical protein
MCAALAIGLAIAGCEKSDETAPGGGTAATPASPSSPATPAETAATPSTPSTPATPSSPSTPAVSATPADATAAQTAAKTESPTTAPTGAAASAEVTQAQTLLDQTVTYIKENKMDLAEKSLTQLEALKPKLPVEYQTKIDSARKAFNAAKTGQGLKLDTLVPGGAK